MDRSRPDYLDSHQRNSIPRLFTLGKKTRETPKNMYHAPHGMEKQILRRSLCRRFPSLGSLQWSPILCRTNVLPLPSLSPFSHFSLHPHIWPYPTAQPHLMCPLLLISRDITARSNKYRFQEVQHHSTTTTSLYFIPCVIAGATTNIASGLLVSRVKANHIALAGAIGTMIAPLLMANMDIEWSYWRAAFWAMCLVPLSADGNPPNPPCPQASPPPVLSFSPHI